MTRAELIERLERIWPQEKRSDFEQFLISQQERRLFMETIGEIIDRLKACSPTDELNENVKLLVQRFYNSTRRHSTIGYVSPIEFEKAREA